MKEKHVQFSLGNRIKVKNRTFLQWLVVIVALWSVLFKTVSILPGALSYLKYLPDAILLALLLLSFRQKKMMIRRDILPLLLIAIGFFVYCLVIYVIQYQSIAYFLWGFRNKFRYYIAFFTFISYLDEEDVSTWFKVMDILFWVNAVLSAFQFFVLGVGGDFLGGIFGLAGASNGFTLCFLCVVIGKTLLEAFDGSEAFWKSMLKCVVSIAVAAMAELKFYFFVFVVLMIGATILTRFSIKKMAFLMVGFVALMIGALLLAEWFGSYGFLSLEELWASATKDSYASDGDINRLSAVTTLAERILTNPLQQVFGLGLGNCDTSAFAVCNTPFYRRYGYLHYTWFTSAMTFLETGYLGLGIYTTFYLGCFGYSNKCFRAKIGNILYSRIAILMSLLCLVLTVYNASLSTESGYMMYFVLAAPFICSKAGKMQIDPKGR